MNVFSLKNHKWLWSLLICIPLLLSLPFALLANVKPWEQLDWLDIVAEGSVFLMVLVWLASVLLARPKGTVTNWIFAGLLCLLSSSLFDLFDEFARFNPPHRWFSNLEAILAVIGMLVMTVAAKMWHQEQQTLSQSLMKRERFYRDHSHCDYITGLYNAEYMKAQLERERFSAANTIDFCVALFDVHGFEQIVREQGGEKADQLLRDIGRLISVNLRDFDLVCRYAGDRFVVLFAKTHIGDAKATCENISKMVATHTQYNEKGVFADFSKVNWSCIEPLPTQSVDDILHALHNENQAAKCAA